MRKQLIPLIITLLFFMGNNCFAQTFGGGNGTAGNPYLISTKAHLDSLATNVNNGSTTYSGVYFKVTTSFPVNGTSTPIGVSATNSFQGYFDGGGNTLSALSTTSSVTYGGLFGYISGATIKNVKIGGGSNIGSGSNVGALVGYAVNSTIDSCITSVNMTGSASCKLGGIIGRANNCTISNCSNSNSNFNSPGANGYYGGIVAFAENASTITKCYSTSTINGGNGTSYMGGLVAYSDSSAINNCYFTGSIQNGSGYFGGLVGYGEINSTISNSYSAPQNFPTATNAGILCGFFSTNSNIINSYYKSNGSTQTYGTSRTDAEMKTMQFAIDLNACQNQTWRGFPTNYPVLYWQGTGTALPRCLQGSGTEADPFRIRCVADLVTLSTNVSNGTNYSTKFLLVENDINFHRSGQTDSSSSFNPIGNNTNTFQGNFNGGGYVISNLTKSGTYVGLFGYISGATISNLGIEGFDITTDGNNGYAGALVGYANNSEISGCYSANSTVRGDRPFASRAIYIGGLIGYLNGTCQLNNSYSRSSLIASRGDTYLLPNYISYVGGLVAYISSGSTISNSYSAPLSLGSKGTRGTFYSIKSGSPSISNYTYYKNNPTENDVNQSPITSKDSLEMKSGCFVVTLNNSQDPVVWFKAKRQVNLGYPVLSWQKLSDGITPAGFEGNCLGYNTPFVGSNSSPYKVQYVKDLIYISNMVANDTTYSSKYFQMLNDINYNNGVIDSSSLYNPIGDRANVKPFSGNFNGLRNAIANYSFSDTTKNNIGFFGYTRNATIQRLGISNINISAKDTVGGLVANADSTKIGGCFVYGYIKGGNNVGGLVGYATGATTYPTTIDTSFTNTTIDAQTNVGGLVGNHNGGTINNSYSNSEIYSSIAPNNYVGGIIGRASSSNLTNVYSTCKIIRNGSNINFGKIKGNNLGSNTNCYSRDSVFVNYGNSSTTGYNGTSMNNAGLRNSTFVSTLGSANWKADYADRINDGYPILKYQSQAVKPNSSGLWPTTTASQVVIIKSGVQLKANTANFPKCAYVKIENGGELNNTTNINLFGEYNRELYAGKWNLIGLSTYNQTLASLYNYADTSFKTFVKEFDYTTNNWSTTTTQGVNTKFEIGEGILVMPNYSLDDQKTIKTRIISKGVLFNEQNYQVPNPTTLAGRFVSLANNYTANLTAASFLTTNTSLVQGNIVYVYDSDSGKWNNNLQSINPINIIKPSEGFFIAASSIGGNFLFDKSQISNTSGAKNTIKSDLIYVKAIANDNVRESFLEFNEEADNGFDFEDGLMLFGNNYNSVEPFFTIPTPEINDSTTQLIKDAFSSLPYTTELDLRSQKTNEVSLNFSNIPSNIHVYLLDSLLNKAQYLNEEPYYNLQVNEGDNAKRLYVLFSYYKEDINEFFKPEVAQEIKIWNYNNNLNIEGRDLIRYELFDIMGNKLLVEDILDDKFKTQLDLGSGIYIVRAYSNTSSNVKKISISSK